jgi:hypothetical protein
MTDHPAWCSPDRCDVTDPNLPAYEGAHRSEPVDVNTPGLTVGNRMVQATSASLYQAAAPWNVSTYLIVVADSVETSMPVFQAAGALAQLAGLVDRAVAA